MPALRHRQFLIGLLVLFGVAVAPNATAFRFPVAPEPTYDSQRRVTTASEPVKQVA